MMIMEFRKIDKFKNWGAHDTNFEAWIPRLTVTQFRFYGLTVRECNIFLNNKKSAYQRS